MKKTGTKKEAGVKTKSRARIGKLKATKETLKDLTPGAKKRIQGGGLMGGTSMGGTCIVKPK